MASNMYQGTKSINPLGGWCKHNCTYCSTRNLRNRLGTSKEKYSGKYRLYEGELKKFKKRWAQVFVCGQNDLFEKDVPKELIQEILLYIIRHGSRDNVYMFQSKNPIRMQEFAIDMKTSYPDILTMWGTTIETDHGKIKLSDAPSYMDRRDAMRKLKDAGLNTYITIEPVVKHSASFYDFILVAKPDVVYLGADSKNNGLDEPTRVQLDWLIDHLIIHTDLRLKGNLERILNPKLQKSRRKKKGANQ